MGGNKGQRGGLTVRLNDPAPMETTLQISVLVPRITEFLSKYGHIHTHTHADTDTRRRAP